MRKNSDYYVGLQVKEKLSFELAGYSKQGKHVIVLMFSTDTSRLSYVFTF